MLGLETSMEIQASEYFVKFKGLSYCSLIVAEDGFFDS